MKPERYVRVRVRGVVQGVGFRPFVHRLAVQNRLSGWVMNDSEGVVLTVAGASASINLLLAALKCNAPPLAVVASVVVEELSVIGAPSDGFTIRASNHTADSATLIPADVRTCTDCLEEMRDPENRRYRHPLINCTNCGPRFTISKSVPYDRSATTMAEFAMCPECASEYADPGDRRFHAEPIACRRCGPRLEFRELTESADPGSVFGDDAAIEAALAALRAGQVLAVKGLGGYLLAVDATNAVAVARLRERKHRDEKPFAVQVASVEAALKLVSLDDSERDALTSAAAPIVLARRSLLHDSRGVTELVAPGNALLGVMLPVTGLHQLLAEMFDAPLVMTSGNHSDEPIIFHDQDVETRLTGLADAVLRHDRQIHRRADDSIVRVFGSRPSLLRRARGYVPNRITLADRASTDSARQGPRSTSILAVGAELKSTVCLTRNEDAFVSTHLGDLERGESFRSFTEAITDLQAFLDVRPGLVVHDLHPEYLSTKWAHEWAAENDLETLAVQHHHAHIASCLADNGEDGPVIGLAFDGHGYGPDATLWGGEFLLADALGYERIGHLSSVALPGGYTAIRQPWRMAVAYLTCAYQGSVPIELAVRNRHCEDWGAVASVAAMAMTPRTSSMGRLFDAVAAVLGLCDRSSFEGQAAIALEQAAWAVGPSGGTTFDALHPLVVHGKEGLVNIEPGSFLRSLADLVGSGIESSTLISELAFASHRLIADAVVQTTELLSAQLDLRTVACSGGVFQNALLVQLISADLRNRGFRVLTHHQVPSNDGGISLGQVAVGRAYVRRQGE